MNTVHKIPLYQVDAFTSEVFKGNPAAVCPLERWPRDVILQNIARENNLSETAFILKKNGSYEIRWFTPEIEIDLCGHATLASGYVVFSYLEPTRKEVTFSSKSGLLTVFSENDHLSMLFPSRPPGPCEIPEILLRGLGTQPVEVLRSSRDYMAVFRTEEEVKKLSPCFPDLAECDATGIIVTAPGKDVDFVSRFFAPAAGITEDPVTGSAHCTLIPYWSKKLNKKNLIAKQVSKRGGELLCEDRNEKVLIGGKVACYMEGTIFLPEI